MKKGILRFQVVKEIEIDYEETTLYKYLTTDDISSEELTAFWNDLKEKENAISIKGIFLKDIATNKKLFK